MISEKQATDCLRTYCEKRGITFDKAEKQMCAFGDTWVGLFVDNPDAPEADGLANDAETLMLPTLYIRQTDDGLITEETEYTEKYLFS